MLLVKILVILLKSLCPVMHYNPKLSTHRVLSFLQEFIDDISFSTGKKSLEEESISNFGEMAAAKSDSLFFNWLYLEGFDFIIVIFNHTIVIQVGNFLNITTTCKSTRALIRLYNAASQWICNELQLAWTEGLTIRRKRISHILICKCLDKPWWLFW